MANTGNLPGTTVLLRNSGEIQRANSVRTQVLLNPGPKKLHMTHRHGLCGGHIPIVQRFEVSPVILVHSGVMLG